MSVQKLTSAWWHQPGLRKLLCLQVFILVSQMTVGYDEVIVGSFQSMEPWLEAMGNPSPSAIGLISALMFAGGFLGAMIATVPADRYGRRFAMALGSMFCILGSAMQAGAPGLVVFSAGRFIIGIGISFTTSAGPSLLNELSHPEMRGQIASMFNVLWYLGSIIASWLCFGTGHLDSQWAWRIPSIVQTVIPMVVLVGLKLMPESPRWLWSKGRHEEARAILVKFHANGDSDAEIVQQELAEISTALRLENEHGMAEWSALLTYKPNRKRLAIVFVVATITLWNGQGTISYYFSPLLRQVGISSTTQQTGINGGMSIWNFLCAGIGALLADRIGRRRLWLTSFVGMIFANVPLIVCGKIYDNTGSGGAARGVIVFMFLYNAAFNLGCNPLPYSYTPELLPYSIRNRGMAFFVLVGQAMLAITQYVNPIAIDSIGWYYYVFFLGVLLVSTALIYYTFPETRGKTLEELGALFGDDEMSIHGAQIVVGIEAESEKVDIKQETITKISPC